MASSSGVTPVGEGRPESQRPYYSADGVTVYWGESTVLMRRMSEHGPLAIVTDPPYGTGWVRGGGAVGEFVARHERPEWDVWSTDWLRVNPFVEFWAVFCPLSRLADLRAALRSDAVAYWRKTNPRPNGPERDAIVLAPTHLPETGVQFAAYNGDTPFHPCQKPVDLMQWVLGFVPPHLTVVDPFCGSGSTLIACRNLNRRCIGIEQDEAHCRTTVTRLSQSVLPLGGVA
jgi:site-specific DNA-methyltransferase (adenine-specific)